MGKRRKHARQSTMWVATTDLPRSAGHPFYERLNRVLATAGFDAFVEAECAPFYADGIGRPGLAPGRYFRLLLLGYFEGLDSERAIAWRAADSLSIRHFLDFALDEAPPDHSTLSRTRRLIDVETHRAVFTWVLQRLAEADLVQGHTLGIDATTLEANAAMRSIVRRDTGEAYEAWLTRLAEASGITTPTRAELARFDRTRKKKGSNDDWTHPHDPDAKITKMKDGRTRLAHTAEHAVDLETGAVVGVTVQDADDGDTTTMAETGVVARIPNWPKHPHRSAPSRTDPVGGRPPELGQPVQDVARQSGFRLLSCWTARSKTVADDRLVSEERVFHAGLLVVSGGLLPPSPTENAHPPDRTIARRGTRPPAGQRRGPGRRHDDPCASRTGRVAEAEGVVGRVGRHPREVPVDVLDQVDARYRVIRRGFSQCAGHDHARFVHAQMEFFPAPPPVSTVFHRGPFALAHDGEPGTVDDEMQAALRRDGTQRDAQVVAPPGESRVIGCGEVDAHHPEDRRQEALRLTQRQAEDESQRQGGFNRQVGVLKLPTTLADADCRPRGDRTWREPESDVASVHERSVVLYPISDVVFCLVLWVNS